MQKTPFIFVQATCLTKLVWSLVRIILLVNKQSIPVGCIPSTLVATTRCQYWGYLVYLPPGIPNPPSPPSPLPERTWNQRLLPYPVDRQTPLKALPSRNFVFLQVYLVIFLLGFSYRSCSNTLFPPLIKSR